MSTANIEILGITGVFAVVVHWSSEYHDMKLDASAAGMVLAPVQEEKLSCFIWGDPIKVK